MKPKILVGADEACLNLVYEKLEVPAEEFYPCTTIGVIHNNELIMTAVFHQYRQTKNGSMVEVYCCGKRVLNGAIGIYLGIIQLSF